MYMLSNIWSKCEYYVRKHLIKYLVKMWILCKEISYQIFGQKCECYVSKHIELT